MDPIFAIGTFVLGAVFNAVIALITDDIKARRSNQLSKSRSQEDRLRERRLELIRALDSFCTRKLAYFLMRAVGNKDQMEKVDYPTMEHEPDWRLMAAPTLLQSYFDLELDLRRLAPGSGVPRDIHDRLGAVESRFQATIGSQTERILTDTAPAMAGDDQVAVILAQYKAQRSDIRFEDQA